MIILHGITLDELCARIEAIVERKLDERLTKKESEEKLLTRKEVCAYLRISPPTLHEWTKQGLLHAYRIGARVYYKSVEVEEGMRIVKYNRFKG